ncbi:MAG: restriction endonuclease subunit S [Carnobacterium sp.]
MNKRKSIPDIRFPDFNIDWDFRSLGDEVKFFSGLTYSPDNIVKKDGTFVLRSSNVKNGEIIETDNVYVENKAVNSINVQVGDIVVVVRNGSRSLIGKHATIKKTMENTVIGAFMTGIHSDHSSFVNALLDTRQFEVEIHKNLGATINQITVGNFKKMQFFFPLNSEQEKIGSFFNKLDDLINLQKQLLNDHKELKKAMLQKMFPQKGESVPRVRFSGFAENWKQKQLEEISLITMGQSPNGDNYTDDPSDYILVQGNADMKNGRVVPRVWTTQVTKIAEKGDLILSVRAPVGEIGKTDFNVVLGRGVTGIRGNEFIYQSLIRMKSSGYWTRYSTGSTFESINSRDIKEALILTPSNGEQEKIGNFFKQLDETIVLYEQKLETYQNLKKAMLQKMFV